LGQQFTFELESPIFGSVIALDCYKNKWYPIPLKHNQSFAPIKIANGVHCFPLNVVSKSVLPLRQRRFSGEHGHCFIIGPHDLMTHYSRSFTAGSALSFTYLDAMAARLNGFNSEKLAICLENVLFE
jgi:hypothetical protein